MELSLWHDSAQEYLDRKNPHRSIEIIEKILDPSSRILFNLSRCHEAMDNLQKSKQSLDRLLAKDPHCAIGFFQRGVISFKMKNYPEALANFEDSQKWVQQGHIDYSQLGMRYKLYLCEVLFNNAVTLVKLNRTRQALEILTHARPLKSEGRHKVIDSVYENLQQSSTSAVYDLIEIPTDIIFRPPKYKPIPDERVDYLGQAKVLSAIDTNDQITGFAGPHKAKPENQPQKSAVPSKSAAGPKSEPVASKSTSADRHLPGCHGPPPNRPVPRLPPANQLASDSSDRPPLRSSAGIRMSEEPPARPPPRKANVSGMVTSMTMSSDENTAPPRPPKRISNPNPDPAAPPTKIKVEFTCNDKQTVLLQRGASLRELKSTACQVFELKPADFDLWTEEPRKKLTSEADVKQLWSKLQGDKLPLCCYGKN